MSSQSSPPKIAELKQRYLGKVIQDSRSPAGNFLALRLTEIERGRVRFEMVVRAEMTNPFGGIHGGMMALAIDESIGWAVRSLESPRRYTSLNLNLDFLYAIGEGQILCLEAKILREGRRILHAEAQAEDQQGRLLATATSQLIVTNWEGLRRNPAVPGSSPP